MMYRTHAAFGAAFVAAALAITKQPLMPITVTIGALAALLPDLDHPRSKISTANPVTVILAFLGRVTITVLSVAFNLVAGLLGVLGIRVAAATDDHRGPFTHSPFGLVLMAVAFLPVWTFLSGWWYLGILLGILSHLVADSLNPGGILWLWPITRDKYRLVPKFLAPEVGSPGEEMVFFLVMAALMSGILGAAWGTGISLQDATGVWPAASGIRVTLGDAGEGRDAALRIAELPKGTMRMPDGSLYFTDGTPVTAGEAMKRGIPLPEGWDVGSLGSKSKALGDGIIEGLKPITDLFPRSPGG